MAKTKSKTIHYLYLFYYIFYAGALWGVASYFILAYIYFVTEKSVLFWLPAMTVFLPATIALVTQVSENISTTLFLSAFYGILLSPLVIIILRFVKKLGVRRKSK